MVELGGLEAGGLPAAPGDEPLLTGYLCSCRPFPRGPCLRGRGTLPQSGCANNPLTRSPRPGPPSYPAVQPLSFQTGLPVWGKGRRSRAPGRWAGAAPPPRGGRSGGGVVSGQGSLLPLTTIVNKSPQVLSSWGTQLGVLSLPSLGSQPPGPSSCFPRLTPARSTQTSHRLTSP